MQQFLDSNELLEELIEKHGDSLKNDYGPTSAFWFSFLEMIETLLAFTRSLRIGNWNMQLAATKKMLPWFFAYDRQNYSRYLTLYLSDMVKLQTTHPSVYQEFL